MKKELLMLALAISLGACGGGGGGDSSDSGVPQPDPDTSQSDPVVPPPDPVPSDGDYVIERKAGDMYAAYLAGYVENTNLLPLGGFSPGRWGGVVTDLTQLSNGAVTYLKSPPTDVRYVGEVSEMSATRYYSQGRWSGGTLNVANSPVQAENADYTLDGATQTVSYIMFNQTSAHPVGTVLHCDLATATTAIAAPGLFTQRSLPEWGEMADVAKVTAGHAKVTFTADKADYTLNLTIDNGVRKVEFSSIRQRGGISYFAGLNGGDIFEQDNSVDPSSDTIVGLVNLGNAGNGNFILPFSYTTSLQLPSAMGSTLPKLMTHKTYAGLGYLTCQ